MIVWFIDKLSRISFAIGCVLLILAVAVTFEQVVARYLFNSSSIAMQELELYCYGGAFLLVIPYVLQINGHVRVDLISRHFSAKLRRAIEIAYIPLVLIPVCAVIVYFGALFVEQSISYPNTRSPTYYSDNIFKEHGFLYNLLAPIEAWIRKNILFGEISHNLGGLEGIWIVKALIPVSFALTLLQGISNVIKVIYKRHNL